VNTPYDAESLELRRAIAADAPAMADVYLDAFKATYDFAPFHDEADIRRWVRQTVIPHLESWVAIDASDQVVALMALSSDALEQLYLTPEWWGRGLGSRLLALAKQRRPRGIRLYTFQANTRARSFYEHHGFRAVRFSDGAGNEEQQPDILYSWAPPDLP